MENNTFNTRLWLRIALINFCVVALAGITLRYKINFPLPLLNQKNLLHGHSHFAFSGWVALALMALMINYLQQQKTVINHKRYQLILMANCIAAYGMLATFIIQGYSVYSIAFSTFSILTSYFFIFQVWRDLRGIKDDSYAPQWFRASLILWAISSIGAFALAYLMANRILIQDYYFAASYFFLHFQYNGWFLFSCFGLLFSYLYSNKFLTLLSLNKRLFNIMAIAVGPTFFLSILWLKLPFYLHLVADISAVLQLVILFYFVSILLLIKKSVLPELTKSTRDLWVLAAAAFILKIVLQMLSTIPVLSSYAFGFRAIVIGFLHLSFLGIISFFIIGFINQLHRDAGREFSRPGVIVFISGVFLQEIVLMTQGMEAIEFPPLPYADMILFFSAILIGTGLLSITRSTFSFKAPNLSQKVRTDS